MIVFYVLSGIGVIAVGGPRNTFPRPTTAGHRSNAIPRFPNPVKRN